MKSQPSQDYWNNLLLFWDQNFLLNSNLVLIIALSTCNNCKQMLLLQYYCTENASRMKYLVCRTFRWGDSLHNMWVPIRFRQFGIQLTNWCFKTVTQNYLLKWSSLTKELTDKVSNMSQPSLNCHAITQNRQVFATVSVLDLSSPPVYIMFAVTGYWELSSYLMKSKFPIKSGFPIA